MDMDICFLFYSFFNEEWFEIYKVGNKGLCLVRGLRMIKCGML